MRSAIDSDSALVSQGTGARSPSPRRTPPGSACSISLGKGIVDTPPGSVQGVMLVVADIHAARADLAGRGVEVSDVQEFPWGSFVFFSDPDGNGWALQQIPDRS